MVGFVKNKLNKNETVIIDEGFIHKGMSFYFRKGSTGINDDEFIEDYLKTIYIPDIIIYMDVDLEVCMNRMSKRNRFPDPFKNLSFDGQKKLFDNSSTYINEVIRHLKLSNTEVIKVKNNDSLNKSYNILKNKLFNIVESI